LDAPVRRVCSANTPHPFNPVLESAMLPTVEKIVAAVREIV
jgi:pyruvate/2-oxoglutarate/acetoin dehydrogenase E1 component